MKVLAFGFALVVTAIGVVTYVDNVPIEVTEDAYFFPGLLVFFGGAFSLVRSYASKKVELGGILYCNRYVYNVHI